MKLIIFDLDGVIIDSKDIHFNALNIALKDINKKFVITREEHLKYYDGLPTDLKLKKLSILKGLPTDKHQKVFDIKQEETFKYFAAFQNDYNLIEIFKLIREKNIKIAVASNCIRKSVNIALVRLGLIEFVDYFVSNEDVFRVKPFPECFWKCMIACNTIPSNTIIFEDSQVGRKAAKDSGANLIPINNREELNKEVVIKAIESLNKKSSRNWIDPKLNILIPMAGEGSRFSKAGYSFPKPLIEVHNKPMIQVVKDNLKLEGKYIFLVKKEHNKKYNLNYLLNLIAPDCNIVNVEKTTEGAACTTLLAEELIDNENPLIIANSDQYINWNPEECMYFFSNDEIDGGILTFKSSHPKWSFAKTDENGLVTEVAEKKPISINATVGIYFWKRGSDYVKYAKEMISNNIRTNNEFYVCPVYNEAIKDGKKIKLYEVDQMWGIGTPEDLNYFLSSHK